MNNRRISPRARAFACTAVVAVSMGAVGWATVTAGAAGPVPSFPDNIVVFPDRDFVSVEGYSEYGGQTATLEVFRTGVGVVGSAMAEVSGTDVAFEINHPGGYCWGEGTGVNVTPDILPGDQVTLKIGTTEVGTTTVIDAQAFDGELQADGVTLIVRGHIGAGVDPTQLEQRIVEPGLIDTSVQRRDVRALLGPMERAPRGGYSSGLEVVGDQFIATYVFDDHEAAVIAANPSLGERALAWQLTDADANRQGLTIAENGEPGGPGFGGCPNGPLQSGPPAPTDLVAAKVINGATMNINVKWTPVTAIPGTEPIIGYRVTALDLNSNSSEMEEVGRRLNNPSASHVTITGLNSSHDYRIEVVSESSVGLTHPAPWVTADADAVPPTITASVPEGTYQLPQTVTLTADEPGVDIYYTLDSSSPKSADGPSQNAFRYTGPIAIAESTTLRFVGFDAANNSSDVVTVQYAISNDAPAAKTSIVSAVPSLGAIDLTWTAADPVAANSSISAYNVRVYDSAAATIPVREIGTAGDVTSLRVDNLTANQPMWFTVSARNSINPLFGPESDRFGPVAAQGSIVADAGVDRTGIVRETSVQLDGSLSTAAGVTYQWVQVTDATGATLVVGGPDKASITNASSIKASFIYPRYALGGTLGALYFRLAVTDGSDTRYDVVSFSPKNDTISITQARWKVGDFRIAGTGATEGATITVRATINGVTQTIGSVPVVAGAWTLRLRTGLGTGQPQPTVVYAISSQGANVGPFTVTP